MLFVNRCSGENVGEKARNKPAGDRLHFCRGCGSRLRQHGGAVQHQGGDDRHKDEMGGKRVRCLVLAIEQRMLVLVLGALQLFLQDVFVLITLLQFCLQDVGVVVPDASGRVSILENGLPQPRADCCRPSGSCFRECATAGIRDARADEKS